MSDNGTGDTKGKDGFTFRNVVTQVGWGLGAFVGAAVLAGVANYVTDGGIIRLLGGLTISQLNNAEERGTRVNCPQYSEDPVGDPTKNFCFLSDVTIRQGNSITADNKGGWAVCKIAMGTDKNAGKLVVVTQMDGKCDQTGGRIPEMTCRAKCVRF